MHIHWYVWLMIFGATVLIWRVSYLIFFLYSYASYYPRSEIAKIIRPLPPLDNFLSPFNKATPEINTELKRDFGSFEAMIGEEDGKLVKLTHLLFPIVVAAAYVITLLLWIFYVSKVTTKMIWRFCGFCMNRSSVPKKIE